MAKKTKKQVAIEKRIKGLKKMHDRLSRTKKTFEKRARREEAVKWKKLDKLQKAADRLQAQYEALDVKALPSSASIIKLSRKLVAVENELKEQEQKLRAITNPQPSSSSTPNGSVEEKAGPGKIDYADEE